MHNEHFTKPALVPLPASIMLKPSSAESAMVAFSLVTIEDSFLCIGVFAAAVTAFNSLSKGAQCSVRLSLQSVKAFSMLASG